MQNRPTEPLTAEYLRSVIHYDPETGVFTRLVRAGLRKAAGQTVGSVSKGSGYVMVSIDYRQYRGHRLAFLYMTGAWPAGEVDHKDGVRSNNCWTNLREAVGEVVNQHNRHAANKNSKTGVLGVTWSKRDQKYTARLKIPQGKYLSLGLHHTIEAAQAAYLAAKRQHHAACTI